MKGLKIMNSAGEKCQSCLRPCLFSLQALVSPWSLPSLGFLFSTVGGSPGGALRVQ